MYPFSFKMQKQKDEPVARFELQYLVTRSEPKEVSAAGRGVFGSRARYLAKHQMLRTIRRLRRSLA